MRTDQRRRMVWEWLQDAGWIHGGQVKAYWTRERLNGQRPTVAFQDLRWLFEHGHVEKRIDYERREPGQNPNMPFVEHRAIGDGPVVFE